MTIFQKTYFTAHYNDLTDDEKKIVLDKQRDINTSDSYWYESTFEDASTVGLKITTFVLDHMTIDGELFMSIDDSIKLVKVNHGEESDTYKIAVALENNRSDDNDYYYEKSLLVEYLGILQKEYDYQQSDECVSQTLITMDYQFDLRTLDMDEMFSYAKYKEHLKRFREQSYTPEQETA